MNKNKIIYALYVFFLLIVFLAALEVWARFTYQKSYLAATIQKDRIFHHLLPPHTKGGMSSQGDFDDFYVTNNRGMRGPDDYEYGKKGGSYRIAVMGDSFTFGVGVKAEETYSYVLQKLLDRSESGRYEVLNFGVSSFSPILELIYLKKELVRYEPEMLVLALDLCDVQDDYFYEPHLVYDAQGEIIACDPFRIHGRPDLWAVLKEKLVLLSVLDDKLFQSFRKMRTIGLKTYFWNKIHKIRNKTEILIHPDIDNIEFDRFLFSRENKNPSVVLKHWSRTAKYLKMIKELCDRRSITLVLVAYPYGHEVGENQWAKGREYWAFEKHRVYDANQAFSLVRSFADENHIPFVSLLEPMRQHAGAKLYYHNDGHWTAEGQKVAGEAIFESAVFRKLIKRDSDADATR